MTCYPHRRENCLRCKLDRLWELHGHDPNAYQYEVWAYLVKRKELAEEGDGQAE